MVCYWSSVASCFPPCSYSTGGQVLAAGVVQPLNGNDLTGWKFRGSADGGKWTVGTATLKEGNPTESKPFLAARN